MTKKIPYSFFAIPEFLLQEKGFGIKTIQLFGILADFSLASKQMKTKLTIQYLAERLKTSKNTVRKHLQKLLNASLISITFRKGRANEFTINIDLIRGGAPLLCTGQDTQDIPPSNTPQHQVEDTQNTPQQGVEDTPQPVVEVYRLDIVDKNNILQKSPSDLLSFRKLSISLISYFTEECKKNRGFVYNPSWAKDISILKKVFFKGIVGDWLPFDRVKELERLLTTSEKIEEWRNSQKGLKIAGIYGKKIIDFYFTLFKSREQVSFGACFSNDTLNKWRQKCAQTEKEQNNYS